MYQRPALEKVLSVLILRGRIARRTTQVIQLKVQSPQAKSSRKEELGRKVLFFTVEQMQNNAGSRFIKTINAIHKTLADRKAERDRNEDLLKIFKDWDDIAADFILEKIAKGEFGWVSAPESLLFGYHVPDSFRSSHRLSIWDLKADILKKGWKFGQLIDFSRISKKESVSFFYDIWGNIHYGYVGRAAGFSEAELFWGADMANIVTLGSYDGISDKTAIQIGIDLYNEGCLLTPDGLLEKLYAKRDCLNKFDPVTGFKAGSCP